MTKEMKLSFMEPDLSFELLDDSKPLKRFRIHIQHAIEDINDKRIFIDFSASNQELKRIISELKDELVRYPKR